MSVLGSMLDLVYRALGQAVYAHGGVAMAFPEDVEAVASLPWNEDVDPLDPAAVVTFPVKVRAEDGEAWALIEVKWTVGDLLALQCDPAAVAQIERAVDAWPALLFQLYEDAGLPLPVSLSYMRGPETEEPDDGSEEAS